MIDPIGADWSPERRLRMLERLPDGAALVSATGGMGVVKPGGRFGFGPALHQVSVPLSTVARTPEAWPVRVLLPATAADIARLMGEAEVDGG